MEAQTLRQILVLTGLTLCSISDGYILGQSSGMIDALRSKNSTIVITEDELYWIASSIQITCFCGFAILAILTEILGRRKAISILNVPILISWVIVYFANNMAMLLISRIILGISYGGVILLTYICVGEYASPNIRSLSLNLMGSVGTLFGASLAHLLSLIMPWRTVALIGIVPTIPAIVIPFFWVESPAWLASKGRFEECKQSFQALHVTNDVTIRELALLISLEIKEQSKFKKNMCLFETIKTKIWIAIKQKYFWKISILNTTINIYRIAGGRLLFTTLAITILKDITGDNDILSS
ncbi:facilitated trehalose transporter Tret1-like [Pieris brassicae]|uniref:facilitated trehalose transporter Tret1-like n=1 Tax=Pieris brassicae TaxID=7116 RepID=UPI001E65EB60|nr:facilitated trehalose transporter Tret1-like [Pieris brassicae]